MRIHKLLGAAFLLVGTVGVFLTFGAYDDLDVNYREDGMIMLDEAPWYPLGVMFIPVPNQRVRGTEENPDEGTFYWQLQNFGRGFCYDEFAANGGNFLIFPCFHLNEPEPDEPANFHWDDYMPCDLTDRYDVGEPKQYTLDLQAAGAAGVKIIASPNLAVEWESLIPESPPYARFLQKNYGKDYIEGGANHGGNLRDSDSRAEYFNTVKEMVEDSGAEEAFLGWCNCWEPVSGRPPAYVNQVYDEIHALEAGANANHAVYLEENEVAHGADKYRSYNSGCDILGYNVRICPTPSLWDENGWYCYWLNNRWTSITGDAADMHFWSVNGAKTLICCVDGVNYKGIYPAYEQTRFMSYDAIIHRVNGLYWGMWHYVYPPTKPPAGRIPDDEVEERLKPVIQELGTGVMPQVLRAPFDDTFVEAVVTHEGAVVERTAFVGADLAPKNHYCSGRYLLEGCVKYLEEEGPQGLTSYVYLVAACREGRDTVTREPENTYEVTFRPYFSGTWAANAVAVVNEGRNINVVNGTFTDTFDGEGAHVYKFVKPTRFGSSP